MKRKPSKRTLKNRQKRLWAHEAENGFGGINSNVVTLGDITSFGNDSTLYYVQESEPFTVEYTINFGDTITISGFDIAGKKEKHGKNLKKVHPARRNYEKKKVRETAVFSIGGQSVTMTKVGHSTWTYYGDDIA